MSVTAVTVIAVTAAGIGYMAAVVQRGLGIAVGMLAATAKITPAEAGQRLRAYAAVRHGRPAHKPSSPRGPDPARRL
ncbi:hypothetical protein [Streptomyces roseus]|uniref:hypothetical protein n=1 Tax=Streptomyces roseus TaxID=66430 RepID=UPI000AEEC5B9|nr:hypothetical protein [Streptomyces roseus]